MTVARVPSMPSSRAAHVSQMAAKRIGSMPVIRSIASIFYHGVMVGTAFGARPIRGGCDPQSRCHTRAIRSRASSLAPAEIHSRRSGSSGPAVAAAPSSLTGTVDRSATGARRVVVGFRGFGNSGKIAKRSPSGFCHEHAPGPRFASVRIARSTCFESTERSFAGVRPRVQQHRGSLPRMRFATEVATGCPRGSTAPRRAADVRASSGRA